MIPKEIRERFKKKKGDPLELFIEDNGVYFMKYVSYGEKDWLKARKILGSIIDRFAILDGHGDCVQDAGLKALNEEAARCRDDWKVYHIAARGESLAYLVVEKECDHAKLAIAVNVLKSFLEEE